jgi:hypothetical protein
MKSTFNLISVMSNPTELWFKEPVQIFLRDDYGTKVDGIMACFVRHLKENETLEDVDTFQEYEDFIGGSVGADVYKIVNLPDGSKEYVEIDEVTCSCYESVGDPEFVTDPFEDGVMV